MICPLMSINNERCGWGADPEQVECQKEKCAWWIKENQINECALKCMAVELITIREARGIPDKK